MTVMSDKRANKEENSVRRHRGIWRGKQRSALLSISEGRRTKVCELAIAARSQAISVVTKTGRDGEEKVRKARRSLRQAGTSIVLVNNFFTVSKLFCQ